MEIFPVNKYYIFNIILTRNFLLNNIVICIPLPYDSLCQF